MATSSSTQKKVTTAKTWKKVKAEQDLELPSGNVCRVKRPGLPELLSDGTFPDEVLAIVQKQVSAHRAGPQDRKGKKGSEDGDVASGMEMMKDPEKLKRLFEAFDRVAERCVIEPIVRLHFDEYGDEIPESAREEGVLYTDEVDFEDKSFIFAFVVGGSSDLERFREEQRSALAGA